MARYYRYRCTQCEYEGVLGKNAQWCPECRASLARLSAETPAGAIIYVLYCPDETFKIGMTADLARRLAQLTRWFGGREPAVIHSIQTDRPEALERELHLRFSSKAVRFDRKGHAEYFHLDERDIRALRRL